MDSRSGARAAGAVAAGLLILATTILAPAPGDDHLVRWVEGAGPPPTAEPLAFGPDGTKARDELGLVVGGIRLSQVEVPIARNTGDNSGSGFCRLFGSHEPLDPATLATLYASNDAYVRAVRAVDQANVVAGYIGAQDAHRNRAEARRSGVGG